MSLCSAGHGAIDATELPTLLPDSPFQHVQHHTGLAEQQRLMTLLCQLLQQLHDEDCLAGSLGACRHA